MSGAGWVRSAAMVELARVGDQIDHVQVAGVQELGRDGSSWPLQALGGQVEHLLALAEVPGPVAQVFTHMGGSLAWTRSMHMLHLVIIPVASSFLGMS